MNDRSRAIALLRQARDILSDRLTEQVLAASEQILEDALGLGYGNEIEQLYEQIGSRLTQVSTMLMQLPPQDEGHLDGHGSIEVAASPSDSGILVQADTGVGVLAPHRESVEVGQSDEWDNLLALLERGDLQAAAPELADWLGIDLELGETCLATLAERCRHSPAALDRVRRLAQEIQLGAWNSALLLLGECFGLQSWEAIGALLHLRGRLMQAR